MTRKTLSTPIGHLAKPSALRHVMRIDRDAAAAHRRKWEDKPTFDPREADRWIDRHGRFTIPNSKGKRND